MLVRLDCACRVQSLGEILQRLGVIALGGVDASQSDERTNGVPLVFRRLQLPVSNVILRYRLVVVVLLLVQRTERDVAQRHSERIAYLQVVSHRAAVVKPCRVQLFAVAVYRADIGIVDGLSEGAVQLTFACQRQSQRTVGTSVVAEGEVDVAQSVERYHPVFLSSVR